MASELSSKSLTGKRRIAPLSFLALAMSGPTIAAGALDAPAAVRRAGDTTPRAGDTTPRGVSRRAAPTKHASPRGSAFEPDTLQARIIKFARDRGGRVSARDVAEAGELNDADAGRAIYRMVLQGVLATTDERVLGSNGLLTMVYRLGHRARLTTDTAAPALRHQRECRHTRVAAAVSAAGRLTPQQYCDITGGTLLSAQASFAMARRAGVLRIVEWVRPDVQSGFVAVHVMRAVGDKTPDVSRPHGIRARPLCDCFVALLAEQRAMSIAQLAASTGAAKRTARGCITALSRAGFVTPARPEPAAPASPGRPATRYTLTDKVFTGTLVCS